MLSICGFVSSPETLFTFGPGAGADKSAAMAEGAE
jgi:hypothetical protein